MRKIAENIVKGAQLCYILFMLIAIAIMPRFILKAHIPTPYMETIMIMYILCVAVVIWEVIQYLLSLTKKGRTALIIFCLLGVLLPALARQSSYSAKRYEESQRKSIVLGPEIYEESQRKSIVLGPEMLYYCDGHSIKLPAWIWAMNILVQEDITAEEYEKALAIINVYGPTDDPAARYSYHTVSCGK